MTAKWGSCIILMICLAILGGCRTPQPELKPAKTAEKLVEPPREDRFDSPGYPKAAYEKMVDPAVKLMDTKNGVTPTRGSMIPNAGGVGGRP
jgi:hypothetical protein